METRLALLTLLVASLPSDLHADCTGSLGVQITNFDVPKLDDVARQTVLIYDALLEFKQDDVAWQEFKQQVTTDLHELRKSIKYLTKLSAGCHVEHPTPKAVRQGDNVASPYPGENRRLACNHPTGEDNMLVGLHDNNQFEDLDWIKCVHYDSVHLGEQHTLDFPQYSNDYVSCGPNEVVTGFGGSDQFMEFIVHLVCRNVTGGRRVTDDCQEVTISADQGHDPTPDVSTKWPVECPSVHSGISAITGIVYNDDTKPKWQKMRCCRLH